MALFHKVFIFFTSILGWFSVVSFTLIHMIAGSIYMLFRKDREWAHMQATFPFISFAFKLNRVKLNIIGHHHIPNQNFIILSNHQSLADVPALILAIRKKFYFIAKKEVLDVPILNISMRLQGHIGIDRNDRPKAIKQIEEIKKLVQNGNSILGFPEGTRSKTGKIGPFKKGIFTIATLPNIPIVPCYINGMNQVMRAKSMLIQPGIVTIKFGKPIYAPKIEKKEQLNQLIDTVRASMLKLEESVSLGV